MWKPRWAFRLGLIWRPASARSVAYGPRSNGPGEEETTACCFSDAKIDLLNVNTVTERDRAQYVLYQRGLSHEEG